MDHAAYQFSDYPQTDPPPSDTNILLKQLLLNATINEHDPSHLEHYNSVVKAIHLHKALNKHNSTHLYPNYKKFGDNDNDEYNAAEVSKPFSNLNSNRKLPPKASSLTSHTAGKNHRPNFASTDLSIHHITQPGPFLITSNEVALDDEKQQKRYDIAESMLSYHLEAEASMSLNRKVKAKVKAQGNGQHETKSNPNPPHFAQPRTFDKTEKSPEQLAEIKKKKEEEEGEKEKEKEKQQEEDGSKHSSSLDNDDNTNPEDQPTPPESFWNTSQPSKPYISAPQLPRPLHPTWTPATYLNPSVRALQSYQENGNTSMVALSGDLVQAADAQREHLRKTYRSETFKGDFVPYLPKKYQDKLQNKYGNYPLATRDRMDELREEQAAQAHALYAKYGDKWPWEDENAKVGERSEQALRKTSLRWISRNGCRRLHPLLH